MIQIRKNVFETNSSSTHTLCIPWKLKKEPIKYIDMRLGEYGWEKERCNYPGDYLWTAINCFGGEETKECKEKLFADLDQLGIQYKYEEPSENEDYYIDHSRDLLSFVHDVLDHPDKLLRFLSEGFICLGNDNVRWDEDKCYNEHHECDKPDVYDYYIK